MVIILVLSLLISSQLCDSQTYFQTEVMHTSGLASLVKIYDLGEEQWPSYKSAYDHLIETAERFDNRNYPIVYL